VNEDEAGTVVVSLSGELDIDGAAELDTLLRRVQGSQREAAVVVDLEKLSFVDSSGLLALVSAHRRSRGHGQVGFRSARGQVKRVLDLTGLSRTLRLVDD
jgi:anti-sigma B factor antagonist